VRTWLAIRVFRVVGWVRAEDRGVAGESWGAVVHRVGRSPARREGPTSCVRAVWPCAPASSACHQRGV